ncbi:hypothetical protein HGRIS_006065 [Hohenbuehelia grisea]|uniref:Uncharacterized protein n=1 Tax=Hohenbuehelia grisea TaxID=104357 RepID=A0ABR3K174_9AGAR
MLMQSGKLSTPELRCLDIIRKAIVVAELDPELLTEKADQLSRHCVNYLRQMVLCRTDMEREMVIGKPKPVVHPDLFECRDWNVVFRELEENQRQYAQRSDNWINVGFKPMATELSSRFDIQFTNAFSGLRRHQLPF